MPHKERIETFRFVRDSGYIEVYANISPLELSAFVTGTCFSGVEKAHYIESDGIAYRGGRRRNTFPKTLLISV